MKKALYLFSFLVLALMTSCLEPWDHVEPCNIRIQNMTGNTILIELVKNPVAPSQAYSRVSKTQDEKKIYVDEGETYTLYCRVSLGNSIRYEDGYSYQVELLSPVSSVEIQTTDAINFVTISYEGGMIHFDQRKENPNT